MCFSATASFTAAAGLSAVGGITIVRTRSRRALLFAAIPLFFGIQQAAEGFVWLSIIHSNALLNAIASHVFVLFAFAFWPIVVPLAVALIEKNVWRLRLLYAISIAGIGLGIYFLRFLLQYHVTGHVENRCIVYVTPHFGSVIVIGLYVIATCISLMLSSDRKVKWFGLATSVSLIITYAFYQYALVSVWCFFSAILSVMVYLHFARPARGTVK